MKLLELYDKQSKLDELVSERIRKINPAFDLHSIDAIDKRIFAFRVELGELANEIGFFKDWKHSHVMDRVRVLDEWADCLHFLLSIALSKQWNGYILDVHSSVQPILDLETSKHLFYSLLIKPLDGTVSYANTISLLVTIGHTLGFTDTELTQAYLTKNEENIRRQTEGY